MHGGRCNCWDGLRHDIIFGQFILHISLFSPLLSICYSVDMLLKTTVTTITANLWSHMRRLKRASLYLQPRIFPFSLISSSEPPNRRPRLQSN